MKFKNIFFIILIVLFVVATVLLYIYQDHNDYVFKINDEKVSVSEFNTYFNLQKKIMEEQYGENVWSILLNDAPAIETARDSAKQSIVDTKIKLQQAQELKLKLTSVEKQNIRTIVKANGKEAMQKYDISLDELVKIYEDVALIQKLSIALYKETDHTGHIHGKIDIAKYESGEDYTEPEKTYDSRHILLKTDGAVTDNDKEAIKKKAENLLNRIKAGEDFATLADQFTEDPGSKGKGGLYEGTKLGDFVTEYEKAALSLNPGEVYPDLVESAHGYHIIKLEKINNPDAILSKDETTKVLEEELAEKAEEWLKAAEIVINQQQYDSFTNTEADAASNTDNQLE